MLVTFLLLVAAVIHLLPVVGVVSAARVEALYGVSVDSPDMAVLLRHRAVLFGLLGAALVAAAFVPQLRPPVIGGGLMSMVSFVVLCLHEGTGRTGPLRKVVVADVVAIVATVGAGVLEMSGPTGA